MIEIHIYQGGIKVEGHARVDLLQSKITCAGISTLVQTLYWSLQRLTEDDVSGKLNSGDAKIEWKSLSEAGRLLVDSFIIGISGVAEADPDNVKLIKGNAAGDERSGAKGEKR